jgi:hypothetical protein
MTFDLSRINAALLACASLTQSTDRVAAIAVFDTAPEFTLNSEEAEESFDQEIISTIFSTMQRSSSRFLQVLLDEESVFQPKQGIQKLLSELDTLFGIIRQLNGDRLPFSKLYELEESVKRLSLA